MTCAECGQSIWWHRVRKTKAGIRAYCNVGGRRRIGAYRPPRRAAILDGQAVDVWGRLHRYRVTGLDDVEYAPMQGRFL